ncbi:MAG: Mov34/MPN/PAD-1 family protein [Candidatus Freyarchaeota archaeon]
MAKIVYIAKHVVDSLLSYARLSHPREGILLLRGKVERKGVVINDVVIPPLATHGHGFSMFPFITLPIDFSIVGVAHSHPSGALVPSVEDLNHFFGKIMLIVAYPYQSERDIAVFDREGREVVFEVVH